MKTTMKFIISGLVVLAIAMGSCSKDSVAGDTGPIGPKGDQGEQGLQGDVGPQGDAGTANVIYSEWYNVTWNGANESEYKRFDINESKITNEFMNTGTALMFMKLGEGVFPLAWVSEIGQVHSFVMRPTEYSGYPGGIFPSESGLSFYIIREGGVASGGIGPVRYVLIPGGESGKSTNVNIDFKKMSYEEVMDYFGLEY